MPTGTPTPTAVPQKRQEAAVVTVDGSIELISPQNDIHVPENEMAFEWIWHENKGCEQPPDGYAFEIRIWRDNDFSGPMGAMDAQGQKEFLSRFWRTYDPIPRTCPISCTTTSPA